MLLIIVVRYLKLNYKTNITFELQNYNINLNFMSVKIILLIEYLTLKDLMLYMLLKISELFEVNLFGLWVPIQGTLFFYLQKLKCLFFFTF